MENSNIKQMITTLCLVLLNFVFMAFPVNAESDFDPDYYASIYPDVVNVLGPDPQVLYNHYLEYGMKEGRIPYKEAQPGSAVEGIAGVMVSQKEIADDVEAKFDPVYYAKTYPMTFISLGPDPQVLYDSYLKYGMKEGRIPYEGATPGAPVTGIIEITAEFTPVPIDKLANLSSLRKCTTDEEFAQAYEMALEIVKPYAYLSRENQLRGIMMSLMKLPGSYSMTEAHYNDPYGYFVLQVASCAGSTRAIGLCLNILGIPYEHVNENQYDHQWCRVEIDGTYWICDEFGLYCGPESAPYEHPRFSDKD